jgi:GTPase Era involved in 16S rRNA processing
MQILGVFNHRNVQLAFYDTPGFVAESSSQALRDDAKDLIKIARDSVSGKPDVVLLVVDSTSKLKDTYQDTFAEMAKMALDNTRMETILVLNKVDMVEPKQKLLTTTTELVSLINGVKYAPEDAHLAELDTTTFMISALKRDGTLDLKNYLISLAERKPWIIAEGDGITELTDRERVEQIVLEHLLDNAHEEIPYRSEVVCRGIKRKIAIKSLPYSPTPEMQQESSVQTIKSSKLNRIVLDKVIDDEADKTDRKVFKNFEKVTQYRIDVDIYVEKAAHRKILIGHKGRTLVKMRQAAVAQLEKIFGSQVMRAAKLIYASKKQKTYMYMTVPTALMIQNQYIIFMPMLAGGTVLMDQVGEGQ